MTSTKYLILLFGLLILCTSLAAAQTQINACQTFSTENSSYILNTSVGRATTCFTVSANNVTIDCNGSSITGTNASSTYGVTTTKSDTTVTNCVISNWSRALYWNGEAADNGIITNTQASSTYAATYVFYDTAGDNLQINNCSFIAANTEAAIYVAGQADSILINNTYAQSDAGNAIYFSTSNSVTIDHTVGNKTGTGSQYGICIIGNNSQIMNSVALSPYRGLYFQYANNATVTNVYASNNGTSAATYLVDAENVTLTNLTSVGLTAYGLYAIGNLYLTIKNSFLSGATFGAYLVGVNNSVMNQTTLISNGTITPGLQLTGSASSNKFDYLNITALSIYPILISNGINNVFSNLVLTSPYQINNYVTDIGTCTNTYSGVTHNGRTDYFYYNNLAPANVGNLTAQDIYFCNYSSIDISNVTLAGLMTQMFTTGFKTHNFRINASAYGYYLYQSNDSEIYDFNITSVLKGIALSTNVANISIHDGMVNASLDAALQLNTNISKLSMKNVYLASNGYPFWLQGTVTNSVYDNLTIVASNYSESYTIAVLWSFGSNNNVLKNSQISASGRASGIYMSGTSKSTDNNIIFNNSIKNASNLIRVLSNASNNTFYANNLSIGDVYVNDTANYANWYNSSTEGNIYQAVRNSSIAVKGFAASATYPSLYIGFNWTDAIYPYSSDTAPTKMLGANAVDWLPLTPQYGAGDRLNLTTFQAANTTTICMWIYPIHYYTITNTESELYSDGSLKLWIDPVTKLLSASSNAGTTTATSTPDVVTSEVWQFVCLARTNLANVTFYLNGALAGTANQSSGAIAAKTTSTYIGGDSTGGHPFGGYIDEVHVFNRTLASTEIAALYPLSYHTTITWDTQTYNVTLDTTNCGVSADLPAYYLYDFAYGYTGKTAQYNATGNLITKLATIPTWIGIILVVALAFIVLSFFSFLKPEY